MVNRNLTVAVWVLFLSTIACDWEKEPSAYNLPSVYVDIAPEDFAELRANVFSNMWVDADFWYDDKEYHIDIRNHGNVSRLFAKKSYNMRFPYDDLFENRRRAVCSSTWWDRSLLRTRLSYDLFKSAGLMTSDNRFVTFFINNDYWGVYYLLESVDSFYLANRRRDLGILYKAGFGAQFTFKGGYDVRVGFEKKPDDGDYSDLEHLLYILDTTPAESLPFYIEEILDVEIYLNYLAVSVLIAHHDGFNRNFFLYRPLAGRFEIIPWDVDRTFDSIPWTAYGENNLSARLLEVEAYRTFFKNRVAEFLDGEFSEENMSLKIDEVVQQIREAYEHDPFLSAEGSILDEEAEIVRDFIRARRAYIQENLFGF